MPNAIKKVQSRPRNIQRYYKKTYVPMEPPVIVEELKCPTCSWHEHRKDYCRKFKRYDTKAKRIVGCRFCNDERLSPFRL